MSSLDYVQKSHYFDRGDLESMWQKRKLKPNAILIEAPSSGKTRRGDAPTAIGVWQVLFARRDPERRAALAPIIGLAARNLDWNVSHLQMVLRGEARSVRGRRSVLTSIALSPPLVS